MLHVVVSAYRHGYSVEDMEHALTNHLRSVEMDDRRVMFVGPSRSGELIELAAEVVEDGLRVFHVMKCRTKYLPGR